MDRKLKTPSERFIYGRTRSVFPFSFSFPFLFLFLFLSFSFLFISSSLIPPPFAFARYNQYVRR